MMEDDDEIDVLGEFNLENLLTKNEQQISSCYDNDHQLGLHCDSQWLIDPSQPWEDIPQSSYGDGDLTVAVSSETVDTNTWTDKERYLLEKGLELFGKSWSRLSQYIGSKSSSQVKCYVKTMGIGWTGKSSLSSSSYGVDNVDLNFTEIIDDMEIPASMEEVIAVVSTAQPTVVMPSPHHRDTDIASNMSSLRKGKRRKHGHACKRVHHGGGPKSKNASRLNHVEDIRDVLTDNKGEDSIVMPSGELVIRMRKQASSLSEESDVDIDNNSTTDSITDRKDFPFKEEVIEYFKEEVIEEDPLSIHNRSTNMKEEVIGVFKEEIMEKDPLNISNREIPFKREVFIEEIVENDPLSMPVKSVSNVKEELLYDGGFIKADAFQTNHGGYKFLMEADPEDGSGFILDVIESEVSVFTEPCDIGEVEEVVTTESPEKETVYKGDLITPSGKLMRVVVDDMPLSQTSKAVVKNTADTDKTEARNKEECDLTEDKIFKIRQLPPPVEEKTTDPYLISGEEERLHQEFFRKRQDCSPNMYIKIRNSIIGQWKKSKPKYLSESSVLFRLDDQSSVMYGLKIMYQSLNMTNVVRRIHAYLEQRGFINFGCAECHYNLETIVLDDSEDQTIDEYDEPEIVRVESRKEISKKKARGRPNKKVPFFNKSSVIHLEQQEVKRLHGKNGMKPQKPALPKTPSWQKPKKDAGGFTMVHNESGDVVLDEITVDGDNDPVVTNRPRKMSTRGIKPIRLIHCKSYSFSNKAPYRVELDVSALLLVDVHSHLSPKCEVIGLLGGVFRPEDNVLTITIAAPCRTILSSNVHCDMCPVSQCESSELITGKGLSVVGWYHSHPNFDPSPSDTDVETQNTLQSWFNKTGKPFVGLIISPYGIMPAYSVSTYRCCLVKREASGPTPYQMEVKLININNSSLMSPSLKVALGSAYKTLQKFQPIKDLNVHKCLMSVKTHLRKASPRVDEPKIAQLMHVLKVFFTVISLEPSKESVDQMLTQA